MTTATLVGPSSGSAAARFVAAVLVTALVLASSSFARAQDDAGLRRLAERLVGAWGDPGQMRVQLHVAELPPALDDRLPLPEFELVGSLARFDREALVAAQVVLDGPEPTTEAFEALRARFEAAGWIVLAESGMSGFVASQLNLFARACAPAPEGTSDRSFVYLNVSYVPGGPSDVRIDFSPSAWEGACVAVGDHMEAYAPVPTLTAPPGATVSSPVMGFGPDEGTAAVVLRGAPPVEDVAEHYEQQLLAQGWERLDDVAASPTGSRSTWSRTVAERRWLGVLALERPIEHGPVAASLTLLTLDGP